jgi:hypothetical protein
MKRNTQTDQSKDAPLNSIEKSTHRDRTHILTLLKEKPTNTIQFREQHGLIELRRMGYKISTILITARSQEGRLHRNVALYSFVEEPPASNDDSELAE